MRRRPRRTDPKTDPVGDDLLVRYRNGDVAAFDEIVETFQERIVQFFYRQCWDLGRAEDLAQTLFLKLIRTASRYRPEGKLDTYLFRVATNLWIDHYRATSGVRRLHSLDQALATGTQPETTILHDTPEQAAEDGEDRARLRAALSRLAEPHRLVFELAIYQELPYAQIGEILDIPVGTVKSRMHNSVRALKQVLADSQGSAEPVAGGRSAGRGGAPALDTFPGRPFPGRSAGPVSQAATGASRRGTA